MRYVSSRIDKKVNDDIYRFYVTNALKILTGNTAKFAGGTELSKTYYDIVFGTEETEETKAQQEQEAQDVIAMMKSKISKVRG